jgi:HK97 family phage prohead protease
MIRFTASPVVISAQDGEGRREIMGVAAPYNVEATVSDGTTVKFLPGSLPVDGAAPKLIQNHDLTQAIGVVTERTEDENGVYFVARISKTAAGNDALELAKDGVLDAVSVGAEPIDAEFDDNGTLVVASARWVELSLVPIGAFPEARITQVAAAKERENTMSETPNAKVETVAAPVEVPAAAPSAPVWTVKPDREFPMPTPGEYMAAMHIGGEAWRQVNAAYKQNVVKSRTAIQAALAQDLTTDTPGLLPTPVLGPVFEDLNFVRPVVSAIGTRAMPNGNGKSFIRPTITQHTTAATQTEGAAVSSQKMTIASNSVTRSTVAGGVFISQQDIDFSDPSALESILRDLSGQYLIKTDDIAADALVAGATASGSTWTVAQTNPASLVTALYDAAREIQEDTNFTPTHIFASPDVWEKIGRQLDADSRPVFGYANSPSLLGVNALGASSQLSYLGTNVMGLELVVDNNFAANTLLVVRAAGFECYENVRGIMTKEDPELLGRNFTYYGYFATFVTDATMIQSIAIA